MTAASCSCPFTWSGRRGRRPRRPSRNTNACTGASPCRRCASSSRGPRRWTVSPARRSTRPTGPCGSSSASSARWATLARFAVLRSRLAGDQRSSRAVAQLERAADDLSAAGWPAAALESRLLAGRLALEAGWTRRGRQQLQQASRHRRRGPVLFRARAWYCEALARRASGNRRGAAIAIRTAVRILDEHRAGLGAIDLRAYASGHRAEATALGLRMAIEDGRAARVLEWAEQSRASHLLLRPVRPPDDPELAGALTELRAIVAELYRRRETDRGAARLVRRQMMLERHIRDHHRQQRREEPFEAMAPVPPSRLAASLGESALVEFIQFDDRLTAVTVVAGRIRLWRLRPLAHIRDHIE